MSDRNDNDDDDFVDDVLNATADDDQDDVDVPYGIDDDYDDNVNAHDDDACIILLDTTGFDILELITSNRVCEVLTIKILLAIVRLWVLHWLIWPLGLVVPLTPIHPPCIKVVQYYLSWCYQNVTLQGCFGQPPPIHHLIFTKNIQGTRSGYQS